MTDAEDSSEWKLFAVKSYLCTCGLVHLECEDACPTQGRTEREVEQDLETSRRCPGCGQVEDCLCGQEMPAPGGP